MTLWMVYFRTLLRLYVAVMIDMRSGWGIGRIWFKVTLSPVVFSPFYSLPMSPEREVGCLWWQHPKNMATHCLVDVVSTSSTYQLSCFRCSPFRCISNSGINLLSLNIEKAKAIRTWFRGGQTDKLIGKCGDRWQFSDGYYAYFLDRLKSSDEEKWLVIWLENGIEITWKRCIQTDNCK